MEIIRQLRKEKRLSQSKLASIVGMDRGYLSAIENGKNIPSFKLLLKIADALGVTILDLKGLKFDD